MTERTDWCAILSSSLIIIPTIKKCCVSIYPCISQVTSSFLIFSGYTCVCISIIIVIVIIILLALQHAVDFSLLILEVSG